jgi:hypothetical protein
VRCCRDSLQIRKAAADIFNKKIYIYMHLTGDVHPAWGLGRGLSLKETSMLLNITQGSNFNGFSDMT